MSGARFARSGRAKFFVVVVALLLMLGMVAIFHNTTRQLDKSREKHLACEQQQESLNEQLQSIIEQKYNLQKNYKVEVDEQMQTRQDLEQKLKKLNEQVTKEQLDNRLQYDKLQQVHKLLQSEHQEFIKECTKSKQHLLDDANELNRKMKQLRSKELQEQSVLSSELAMWQEKYNLLVNEKERLETLLNVGDAKNRLVQLEHIVAEYQTHCHYQPKAELVHLLNNKPLDMPQIAPKSSPQTPKLSESSKSFNQQVRLEEGRYQINIFTKNTTNNKTYQLLNSTTTTAASINKAAFSLNGVGGVDKISAIASVSVAAETAPLSFAQPSNGSLILNSVENFQIAPQINKKLADEKINNIAPPLNDVHKPSSTEASKVKQNPKMSNLQMATNKTSRAAKLSVSSTSNMPPLQFPPQVQQQQSRKLPDNVAPIPEHFEDLLKGDEEQRQPTNIHDNNNKEVVETQGDAAMAETQKEHNMLVAEEDNNNRYANVMLDGIANKDVKENESYMNEQSFNVPNNENDHNFFDAADDTKKNVAVAAGANNKADGNNAADDFLGNGNEAAEEIAADVGDIEVKQNKNILSADNVNNELAADQGKEFDDGLRLEEDDADEDEYPNLARQQGEEAIRN